MSVRIWRDPIFWAFIGCFVTMIALGLKAGYDMDFRTDWSTKNYQGGQNEDIKACITYFTSYGPKTGITSSNTSLDNPDSGGSLITLTNLDTEIIRKGSKRRD